MPSFFDKLKKGMNIESGFEEPEEEQSPMVKKQKPVVEKKQAGVKRTRKPAWRQAGKKEASFAVQGKKTKKMETPPEDELVAEFLADEEQDKEKESPRTEAVLPSNKEEPEAASNDKEEMPSEEPTTAENINLSEIQKIMEPKKKANKITNIMANTTITKEVDEDGTEENTEETPEKTDAKQEEAWPDSEGELVVDVYQTDGELVVQSAVAGIRPEDLDIDIEKDILVIKGARKNSDAEKRDYFFQECYWGAFSRQIILPVEVDASRVKAEMREGVLTIRMPKIIKEGKKKISVQAS